MASRIEYQISNQIANLVYCSFSLVRSSKHPPYCEESLACSVVAANFPTSIAAPLPDPGGTIYHYFCKHLLNPLTQHRSFRLKRWSCRADIRHGKRKVASTVLLTLTVQIKRIPRMTASKPNRFNNPSPSLRQKAICLVCHR